MTVAEVFRSKRNSLNFLRLVFAGAVIVSHSWPVGGFGAAPQFGDQNLGYWAVAGFFAISGYLITRSRLSKGPKEYLWHRFLRIYPAFFVCLLVVAFAFAPLSVVLGEGTYSLMSAVKYVLRNSILWISQWGIDETIRNLPFWPAWDAPLWTLSFEFGCYIAISLIVTILPLRLLPAAVIAVFTAATAANAVLAVTNPTALHGLVSDAFGLLAFFFAGAILSVFATRIPVSPWLAATAALAVAATGLTGSAHILSGLPVAYLCIWLGIVLPFQAVGRRNDVSYGVYIYGFPIQQTLAVVGAQQLTGAAVAPGAAVARSGDCVGQGMNPAFRSAARATVMPCASYRVCNLVVVTTNRDAGHVPT